MIVVDSSLALQWVLDEPDGNHAERLLLEKELAAPDILFVEVANVLAKKVRHSQIDLSQGIAGLEYIREQLVYVVPSSPLVGRGLQLSVALSHPVYDCIFLACAENLGGKLATRDAPFAKRLTEHGFGHLLEAAP